MLLINLGLVGKILQIRMLELVLFDYHILLGALALTVRDLDVQKMRPFRDMRCEAAVVTHVAAMIK